MFCSDVPAPIYFILSESVPKLLYYSHIPTAVIAILFGLFVFFKNKNLLSKILLAISLVFSLWLFFNLIAWTNVNSAVIMFVFSLFGVLNVLLFALSLYFSYAFIEKKDVNWKFKLFLFVLMAPFIIFHAKNFSSFNLVNCEAIDNSQVYSNFVYAFEFLVFLWILVFGIYKFIKEKTDFRKQILLLIVGIELFLFSFFVTGFLATYLQEKGVSYAFEIEQYGLFGMTVFLGFLGYLIVKFKAFDIKLLGAQALAIAQFLLIASMFAFATGLTSQILIGVTLIGTTLMGGYVIRSVKEEVRRKEELQLMSEKLSLANDQLRKLDNAKSEFISIASHQLRTPLTAIKGFVSLILEGTYGEVSIPVREALNKIYLSGERLINLVENLLNISRIESGRMEYQMNPIRLEDTLNELFDTFTIIAKGKGLTLEMSLPEHLLPEIKADQPKIREVISNFIDNALKYTKKGGVKIYAEVINDLKKQITNNFKFSDPKIQNDGVSIRITIADTGIGIPESEIQYLFAKFSRGKDTTRLNAGGTGLGLYVAKNIVEAHGGKVWVESDGVDRGSRFIIELPVHPVE